MQSDQSTIVIGINRLKDDLKGTSYWRFNSSLLSDKTFTQILVSSNVLHEYADPRVKWDFLKYKVRQFAKDYARRKAINCKTKRVSLETKVREFESVISTNSNDSVIEEYHKFKAELEEIYDYIAEGIILKV